MTGNGDRLRLFYAAGPGDVAGTFRAWRDGVDDPSETAVTYAAQFFDLCRELDADALVVASHARSDRESNDRITVEHCPAPWGGRSGLAFHHAHLRYTRGLMRRAAAWGADVAILASLMHWHALGFRRPGDLAIVPSIHGAFWPEGHRPQGRMQRWLQRLNGRFWRQTANATICVSPTCERQTRELAGEPCGPLLPSRPLYRRDAFDAIPTADLSRRPFELLYAGRMETSKGVFDLLDVARRLCKNRPGEFRITFAGAGSAAAQLRDVASAERLGDTVAFAGRLDRDAMLDAYGRCHAVAAPTTRRFAEGLNKVAVEGVLARRAVLATRYANAADVLGDAVTTLPEADAEAWAAALMRLADDADHYAQRCTIAAAHRVTFFDAANSWGAALRRALAHLGVSNEPRAGERSPKQAAPSKVSIAVVPGRGASPLDGRVPDEASDATP